MTRATYSTYDAKARFSELLRKVRAGESVFITYRGREVAEIRPVSEKPGRQELLARLESRGTLAAAPETRGELTRIADRPGALERFLESRE